jgi:hypothetical protein
MPLETENSQFNEKLKHAGQKRMLRETETVKLSCETMQKGTPDDWLLNTADEKYHNVW